MSHDHPSYSHRDSHPSLFWPILLIGVGIIFLLSNLGFLPPYTEMWPMMWKLWPLILVVIGLDILLGRRSVLGGILSAVFALLLVGGIVAFLFIAQSYPELYRWSGGELRSDYVTHPVGNITQADVNIGFPGGSGQVFALEDSSNLIEADLRYYGSLSKSVQATNDTARVRLDSRTDAVWWPPIWWEENDLEKWTIGLSTSVAYDMVLDSGSGQYEFDLHALSLRSFDMDAGSGQVKLTLPEDGQYRFRLSAGSGEIDIRIPEGVAVRVEYESGSGELSAPYLQQINAGRRDGVYESAEFSQSGPYVIIEMDGGSGDVTIH